MFQHYNGINIFQSRDFVKISVESYINCMLQMHGWDEPKHNPKEPPKAVPLNPATVNKLLLLTGPPEKSAKAKAILDKVGFSYHNVLGELIFAYVICRLDIGYSVCFLACFSDSPHEEHYFALKGVV